MDRKIPHWVFNGNAWIKVFIDPVTQYQQYLATDRWMRIRSNALDRAGDECERCSSTRYLQVHHKTYKNVGNEKPEDLLVLCEDCHLDEHGR